MTGDVASIGLVGSSNAENKGSEGVGEKGKNSGGKKWREQQQKKTTTTLSEHDIVKMDEEEKAKLDARLQNVTMDVYKGDDSQQEMSSGAALEVAPSGVALAVGLEAVEKATKESGKDDEKEKEDHVGEVEKSAMPEQEMAIKIYKTSILVFKDRDRYVTGEFRFRRGYNKKNPRKMVKVWAEKEMRNLIRIRSAGVRCPTPLFLRQHVLGMTFIGKKGWPAPRLKDAQLTV